VKVRAALASDASVFTETQGLLVASGPPSQRFMSLSVETVNIEAATRDGVPTKLVARLADRQGNAVEDGTVINFTAEGGQVAFSCATRKVNNISSCSVDFMSQNPRPWDGRISVLAFTSGTKDYQDLNGNNRYDAGTDVLVNIGDAYRDDNENDVYDLGEFIIARGGADACAGVGNSFPARANTCSPGLDTTVRQQAVILFSSSEPASPLTLTELATNGLQFKLSSRNYIRLPMPAGTTVAASSPDSGCSVTRISPSTVPNVTPGNDPAEDLSTLHSVFLSGCTTGQRVVVTVTAPSGLVTDLPAVVLP